MKQPTPLWSLPNMILWGDDAAMARGFIAMGLKRLAVMARGDFAWWQPEYLRGPARDEFGRGWKLDAEIRDGVLQAAWEERRERLAALNRNLRDSRVFLMQELKAPGHYAAPGRVVPAPDLLILVDVDAGAGEWRTASGGAQGEDFISLAAFCWRTTRGKAAARLSSVFGYRRLPLAA